MSGLKTQFEAVLHNFLLLFTILKTGLDNRILRAGREGRAGRFCAGIPASKKSRNGATSPSWET